MLARCAPAVWLLLAAVVALAAGCGEDDTAAGVGDRVTVVATTTQAADLVRNVGGPQVEVVQLLAPNADPHDYEVRPRDVQALADADLIVRSGGDVDEWLGGGDRGRRHGRAGADAERRRSRCGATTRTGGRTRATRSIAIAEIRAALDRPIARTRAVYDANAAAYSAKLRRLDRAVAACIAKVPQAQRKLVTTHDALGYYARRYGIDVIGAVIPSLTTEGQPSAGDTAELVRTIEDTGVKAIFAESSVNPKVEAAIARETGAKVGKALWADTLGPEGSDGATYLQSIASNTRALVDGFTGGAVTCSL